MVISTICYSPPKKLLLFNRDNESLIDMSRLHTNHPAKPCWPAFLVTFPAIQLWEHRNARAGDSGTAVQDIHYPWASKGKTALNDSLTMTIGGVRYTVRSVFAEDGGDFREMFEAAVVSRAARCLSAQGTGAFLTGTPAGQEA